MKQLLLVALLSALASSAMTLLVAGALRPAAPTAAAPASGADFKTALADLEREVASMRREAAVRSGAAPAPSTVPGAGEFAAPRPSTAAGAPVVRDSRSPESVLAVTEALKRFREAMPLDAEGGRDDDARVAMKKRWLFHDEREVLDWFGLPYHVAPEGELETWYYEIPNGRATEEGDPDHENFWIKINRGRLVDLGD